MASAIPTPRFCHQCGQPIATGARQCDNCHALVHADRLKELAADAQARQDLGELSAALASWREALELLPPETQQYQVVLAKIRELSDRITAGGSQIPADKQEGFAKKAAGGLGGIALLLWKFKTAILIALSKGKFLIFGLSKMSTLISMFLSFGFYWVLYGWQFGAGLVLSIFVHEMGHVWEIRKYGIRATAPMFIPGFGAFIGMQGVAMSPQEEARIGLAGPMWGFGAALFCYLTGQLTGSGLFFALAKFGAVINLFNLIPVWQLDGSHAFKSLTGTHRWIITAAAFALFALSREGMLLFIGAVAAFRAWKGPHATEPDSYTLNQFLFLLAGLSLLSMTPLLHAPRH